MVRGCLALLGILMMLIGGGCSYAYRNEISRIVVPYTNGNYPLAASAATAAVHDSAKNHPRDTLVFLLEQGATNRADGQIQISNHAFDRAYKLFQYYDQQAKVRISKEAMGTLVNMAALNYEGYGYDRIMVNVYAALNYLGQGDKADARVEIHRVADAQRKSIERFRDKIKQDQQAAAQASREHHANLQLAQNDSNMKRGEQQMLGDYDDPQDQLALSNLSPEAVYANPFAEYLQGLFFLYSDAPGDREVGRVALRNAAGMKRGNAYAVEDARLADQAAAGGSLPARTYVIFATGMAPKRDQIRIDVPVFLYNIAIHDTRVDYVGMAFPVLKKVGNDQPYLLVNAGGRTYRTAVLANMDQIIGREFKNDLPGVIVRAVISAAVKAAINYGAAEATKNQNIWIQLAARGTAAIYAAVTNEADIRTWRTLPKYIELASFPTPADGMLHLSLPNPAAMPAVHVPPGKSTLVWIRCPSNVSSCVVRSFVLN